MNKQQINNNGVNLPRQVRRVIVRQKPKAAARRAVQRVIGIPSDRMGPPPVSLIRATAQQGRPMISSSRSNKGDLRINVRFREYVQDIAGSINYAVQSLAVNPGLPSLFPWLSAIAANFESYCFNRLGFEYRTESASSATGKVILTADFDASDPVPASKQAQLQERAKADDACWQNFSLELDAADLKKLPQRYIRSVATPASTDIKLYDVANLLIGTQGEINASAVGELYVHYDVELITPNPSGLLAGQSEKIALATTATANVFIPAAGNTITGAFVAVVSAANTLLFSQPGQYLILGFQQGTGLAGFAAGGTATTLVLSSVTNAAGTVQDFAWAVNVTAGGQTLIVTPVSTTQTGGSMVHIAPYMYADG